MKKLLLLLVLLFTLSFVTTVEVDAKRRNRRTEETQEIADPLIIDETITVTEEGGKFKVGFAKIVFKEEFIDEDDLPITFRVQIYAENGEVFIEFTPDVDSFDRPVKIKTNGFEGFIYDVATGENIYVEVPKQQFKVKHFSRYCWAL